MSTERDIDKKLQIIMLRDPRYHRDAYHFVREALDFAIVRLGRKRGMHHVTPPELLDGFRELARERFGMMARLVMDKWGLRSTADIGEIVFNMIDEDLMGRQDSDSRVDFDNAYDFEDVFDRQIRIEIED